MMMILKIIIMMMIIITMIMIIVIIAIIIALKGAIRDFYDLITGPRIVSNTCAEWPGRNSV